MNLLFINLLQGNKGVFPNTPEPETTQICQSAILGFITWWISAEFSKVIFNFFHPKGYQGCNLCLQFNLISRGIISRQSCRAGKSAKFPWNMIKISLHRSKISLQFPNISYVFLCFIPSKWGIQGKSPGCLELSLGLVVTSQALLSYWEIHKMM